MAGETIRKMNPTVPILYVTGYDFARKTECRRIQDSRLDPFKDLLEFLFEMILSRDDSGLLVRRESNSMITYRCLKTRQRSHLV